MINVIPDDMEGTPIAAIDDPQESLVFGIRYANAEFWNELSIGVLPGERPVLKLLPETGAILGPEISLKPT
ncbi:MAG: hypothetical protein ACKO2X_04725, partial [Bacteroidota bacterium]